MAANEVGIELILSAPDVKGVMDEVIDAWKELSAQEKLAKENLEKYIAETAKQQAAWDAMATSNKKLKEAVEELELSRISENKTAEKGILATISAYGQQKAELKNIAKEVSAVSDEILRLEKRQESIFKLVHRGNTLAGKEYVENNNKIKELTGSLSGLNDKIKLQSAVFASTKAKINDFFSGFRTGFSALKTGFNVLKTGAAVAITGIVASLGILIGTFALVKRAYERTFQNDFVDKQLKQSAESFKRARQEFADAMAPIGIAVAHVLDTVSSSLAKSLTENSHGIFVWAANVGGVIAGVSASIGEKLKALGLDFDILFEKINRFGLQIAAVATAGVSEIINGGAIGESTAEIERLRNLRDAADRLGDAQYLNAKRKETAALLALEADVKVRDLTKEQLELIKKLREEYKRLTADINKQIEALDVKEAGPFAGVLLKAQLAAREIEAQGELAVSVAKKLGKSKAEIDKIRESISRLSQAVKDDAVKFLTDQSDTIINGIQSKLDELRAARAGGEDELKFKNDIEAQRKEIDIFRQIKQTLIEDALNKGAATEVINELISDLQMANELASALANNTALDFFSKKAVEKIEAQKVAAEESLKDLEEIGERLRTALDQDGGSIETNKTISLQIKVNDESIAVAREQIRQFEDAFEIFKKTGVLGVVETEAQIKVRVSGADAGITGIKPNLNPPTAGETGSKRSFFTEGKELEESLDLAVGLNQIAFDTITSIALSSVDAQIEALDRLNEARADSVSFLQDQLDREAQFKANGLANDYDITKKQLSDAVKLQEEGAKKQEELNKKRARIQQQQNDAQTFSSLATAVANIISGWSTVPIVGSILGIAAAAAMLVSFAATKAQAAKYARAYKGSSRMGETFGQLAPGEGYDDSPGRDRGLSVVDSRGRLRGFVGGDEYLHKQSVSRKHRSAFDYLNNNESKFQDVNILAMLKAMENSNVNQVFDMPDMSNTPRINYAKITAKNERLRERMVVVNGGSGITKDDMHEAIEKAIDKQTQAMIAYHESRPDRVPNDWLKDYTEFTSKSKKSFKKG